MQYDPSNIMSVNELRKKRRILLKFIGALLSLVKGASMENLFKS